MSGWQSVGLQVENTQTATWAADKGQGSCIALKSWRHARLQSTVLIVRWDLYLNRWQFSSSLSLRCSMMRRHRLFVMVTPEYLKDSSFIHWTRQLLKLIKNTRLTSVFTPLQNQSTAFCINFTNFRPINVSALSGILWIMWIMCLALKQNY